MEMDITSFFLQDDGQIPNNSELPVVVYKGAFADGLPIEETFQQHNWKGSWTGDVFDYHHYHSNTHEVLAVKEGEATILVGGDEGERLELKKGDAIVLPAGTGHKKLQGSHDFEVVGAYPDGASYNTRKQDPADRTKAIAEIKNVPVPQNDPVFGEEGPLLEKWIK